MKKKCLALLAAIVMELGLCTGCGSSSPEVPLAVVVGVHSNAMEIPLNSPSIKEAIYYSCYTYGSISFVSVDGNPKVYYQTKIPEPEVKGLTKRKKQSIANGYTEQLLEEINHASPEVSEVDTLKAIRQASLTLAGGSETAEKVMVIMDSGLSTVGYLDFTKGLLNADVESIVDALEDAEAIPDLQGITVKWLFSGQTASPQPELSERQKKKLRGIWEAVLLAGGAKEVEFTSDIASDISGREYPEVSIVDVESREIEVEQKEEQSARIIIEKPLDTIVLDNTSVQFVGDKAIFVDRGLALKNIGALAEQLLNHPNNKVYVIGTTASGNQDYCDQLSSDRAHAVVDVLTDFNVPESQLIPMGMGYEDPWHIDDLDAEGKQIEELAHQNRKVLIVDVNGSDAEKLK